MSDPGPEDDLLVEYVRSGCDEAYVGRASRPCSVYTDVNTARHIAALGRFEIDSELDLGRTGAGAEAPPPYVNLYINESPTSRRFESFISHDLPPATAVIHAGDDYRFYAPIRVGTSVEVSCEIVGSHATRGRAGELTFITDLWRIRDNEKTVLLAEVRRTTVLVRSPAGTAQPESSSRPLSVLEVDAGACVEWDRVKPIGGRGASNQWIDHGVVSLADVTRWMGASELFSPVHVDASYALAQHLPGGRPLAPSAYLGALLMSSALRLGGPGSRLASIKHEQRAPVNLGEHILVGVTGATVDGSATWLSLVLTDNRGEVRNTGEVVLQGRDSG